MFAFNSFRLLANRRMSMFFFRLHNLQREEANKKKKKIEQRQRRGAKVFRRISRAEQLNHYTAPSRLFEKTPMNPSDSLDEIALQIPRFESRNSLMCIMENLKLFYKFEYFMTQPKSSQNIKCKMNILNEPQRRFSVRGGKWCQNTFYVIITNQLIFTHVKAICDEYFINENVEQIKLFESSILSLIHKSRIICFDRRNSVW